MWTASRQPLGEIGAVLRAVAQPHKVALAEYRSVVLDQFAFEDEKLLVAIVAVRTCRHAGRHAVDMETDAERLLVIELEHTVAHRDAVLEYERFEFGLEDVGNATVGSATGFMGLSPFQYKYQALECLA